MYFEKTNKPWFGPTKRARDILTKSRKNILEPKNSIDNILKSLEISESDVNHLKFYDFTRVTDNFRFTIVIVQTISNPIIRDRVFFNAIKCVESCGWYPLVQGERLKSTNNINIVVNENINLPLSLNKLLGYESACNDGDGTSIRLIFENGSILFDSALPQKILLKKTDKVVFLSHSHADHTGGILDIIKKDIQVVINKETYLILCSKRILDENYVYNNLHIIGNNSKIIIDSYEIKSLPVPHCFGSIGYKCDFDEIEILFTGDIVIKTNRFDYTNILIDSFKKTDSKKFIFLDSTMCMRNDGASQFDTANEILNKIEKVEGNVILITSRDSEQLVYSLIDLFYSIKNKFRNQYSFILPRHIKKTVSVIHESFIKSKYDDIDRILYGQYGNSKSAWGESRWIYWVKYEDEIETIINDSKSIVFLTHNDIDLFPCTKEYPFLAIGKIENTISSKLKGNDLSLDTTPWTMHSSKNTLTNSIIKFNSNGIRTVIFHDFSKRMIKYCEQFDFEVGILNTHYSPF